MNSKKSKSLENKIVISGVGFTSPLGNNYSEVRQKILNKESGISIKKFDFLDEQPVGICDFNADLYQNKKMLLRGTRASSIAVYCANQALIDSKLNLLQKNNQNETAVIVGVAEHGSNETSLEINKLLNENLQDISLWSPYHNLKIIANSTSGDVANNLSISGPHFTVSAACASGSLALIQAIKMIQLDEAKYVLCGGVSGILESYIGLSSFFAQALLAKNQDPQKSSRPLDIRRNGVVLSEGGAIFMVEKLSSALGRSAKIYCEIEGYHMNTDHSNHTNPSVKAQKDCITGALSNCGIFPSEIDLVNLHATGTVVGDITECQALKEVFGQNKNTHFNSTKANLGHALGASSCLEVISNLNSFEDNLIHPILNIDELDPKCALPNLIIDRPKSFKVSRIMKNSFGMMGTNICMIFKKYPFP